MSAAERLMSAVTSNDVDAVRRVIAEDPAAANARGPAGESPLLAAIYRNADQIVSLLAERRELDLHEAAVLGNVERVRELLAADPAQLSSRSADGWTALHLAAFYGKRDVAALLLERGADVGALSSNYMANTALHAALAGREDADAVELLIARGADVNARGAMGYTPLHIAASRGNGALVERLLSSGAHAGARTDDGKTPALTAAEHGHEGVASRLREAERT
jgi:ankyrin repeat protein